MGLLDTLAGAALNQVIGSIGGNNPLVKAALNMLTGSGAQQAGTGGGLGALLQQLQGSGIADAVSSWISTGPNKSVSPDQLQAALGADKVQAVAQEAGVTPEQASTGLAQLLPNLINHLTPDGTVPNNDLLNKGLGMLKATLKLYRSGCGTSGRGGVPHARRRHRSTERLYSPPKCAFAARY
jgi:uncharacterized protein YidB (DUF937 family)